MFEELSYWDAKLIALEKIPDITKAREFLYSYMFSNAKDAVPGKIIYISKATGNIRYYLTSGKGYEIRNDMSTPKFDMLINWIEISDEGDVFHPGYYTYYPTLGAVCDNQCCLYDAERGWIFDIDGDFILEPDQRSITPREAYRIIMSNDYCFSFFD